MPSTSKTEQLLILKVKKTENKIKSLIKQGENPEKELFILNNLLFDIEKIRKETIRITDFQRNLFKEYLKL